MSNQDTRTRFNLLFAKRAVDRAAEAMVAATSLMQAGQSAEADVLLAKASRLLARASVNLQKVAVQS